MARCKIASRQNQTAHLEQTYSALVASPLYPQGWISSFAEYGRRCNARNEWEREKKVPCGSCSQKGNCPPKRPDQMLIASNTGRRKFPRFLKVFYFAGLIASRLSPKEQYICFSFLFIKSRMRNKNFGWCRYVMCNTFFLLIVVKQFTLFYINEFDFLRIGDWGRCRCFFRPPCLSEKILKKNIFLL